jgi:Tfp pilus assembly protein PilN
LGEAALNDAGPRIDWLADRLHPPTPRRYGTLTRGAVAAAALLLLAAGVTFYFWQSATSRLDQLQAEIDAIASDASELERLHDQTRAAAGWFDDRLPILDGLLELTRAFPREGRVWVTQFTLDENRGGLVRGQAGDEATMLVYLNAMRAAPALTDLELRDWTDAGRDGRAVTFEITFQYQPGPPGPPEPPGAESKSGATG